MMNNILLLGVTYHSYDELEKFVLSVEKAAVYAKEQFYVTVAIGDNTDSNIKEISLNSSNIEILTFPYHENIGYLGCAFRMLRDFGKEHLTKYKFISISNIDVLLEFDFFLNLASVDTRGCGWLAPDIFTPSRGTHENPFMVTRPTKYHFMKWQMMYASPLLYGIMERLSQSLRSQQTTIAKPMSIYAGHGSFMLFTGSFILSLEEFVFPSFMYAEEIYFAEKILERRLCVEFCPVLRIKNTGSVSVSVLGKKWKCKQNRDSLRIIKKLFFS